MIKQFTVAAIIIHRATKKVLLVHHRRLNIWLGPGGHIHDDEDPIHALKREVYEETRLRDWTPINRLLVGQLGKCPEVVMPNFIEINPVPADNSLEEKHEHINLVYYGTTGEEALLLADKEHFDIGWFSHEQAKKLKTTPSMLYHIQEALRRSP